MEVEHVDDEFGESEYFEMFDVEEISNNEIGTKYLKCLKENFGHSSFRTMQWKVISSVMLDKRDNCVVMATGYGKSLCFQFTSVYLDTVTVVVSPLISLMEDQVLSLTLSNIKSCLLGSAQKDKSILDDVLNFKYNLVYVTPEYVTGSLGEEFLKKLSPKLSLIAIDEAHCISKWGHDFRSAFRNLGFIRSCVPNIPILAMTATATKTVQDDICTSLKLINPQIVCTGFDRPNLEFNVAPKSSLGAWKDIGNLIKSVRSGSIIIYCLTKKNTDELCAILQYNGIECKAYHAGLSLKERKEAHENFVRDKIQIIVATIAFGMGIDKPDVRMVIHYGVSKDIESYYQEVGRAGRDGSFSKCYMFYSNQDWKTHDILLSKSLGTSESKENRRKLTLKIREYCSLTTCRREFIIKYFEGANTICKKSKNCCDNCKSNLTTKPLSDLYEELSDDGLCDFTKDTDNFLSTLKLMNGWKGVTTIIHFLRGSKRQSLGERYFNNTLFGIGKHRSEEYYKMLADLLEVNGYITKKSLAEKSSKFAFSQNKHLQFIYVLTLTEFGHKWIQSNPRKSVLFKPGKAMFKFFKLKNKNINISENSTITTQSNLKLLKFNVGKPEENPLQNLVASLLKVRSNLASSLDVMPYMVLSNKAIHQLAEKCPLNLNEFNEAKLDGVSEIKAKKFGPSFVKCILQFKNFMPPEENIIKREKTIADWLKKYPLPDAKALTATINETIDLFNSGKSIREIAQIRHLAESTISNYICQSMKHGLVCDRKHLYRLGVSDSDFNLVTNIFKSLNNEKVQLKVIKEKCPPTTTYDTIKLVLVYNEIREHLRARNIRFTDPDNLPRTAANLEKTKEINLESKTLDKIVEKQSSLQLSSIQVNTNNNENSNWESDEDLDFTKIDNNVLEGSLCSITSHGSTLANKFELIKEFSENSDGDDELNWAIENMQTENNTKVNQFEDIEINQENIPKLDSENQSKNISQNIKNNVPVKRKINLKRKAFTYEDNTSDEN